MKKTKLLIGLCALTAVIGLASCDNSEEPPIDNPPVEVTEFTVTFNSQQGSAVSTQRVKDGEKVTEPTAPIREGYTFRGWYKEAACTNAWNFANDTVSGSLTLYAKWEKEPDTKTFTVRFDSDGGSAVESQKIEEGKKATRPVSPTKEGYLFMGWYKDSNKTMEFDFNNGVITKDITLYAKWEKEPDSITVFFNSKEGSLVNPITNIESGSKITKPTDPTRTGYRFVGWFKDTEGTLTEVFDFETEVITESITLYAKWEINVFTVTFNSDGGSTVESQEIEYNKKASRPVSPTKEGYLFMGWYKDESHTEEFDFVNSVITKNITLYAKWEKEPDSITVFFNSKDGSAVEPITNIESGSKITRPADPVREGYRFVGWFKDTEGTLTEAFDFETEVITKSITLYAQWEANVYRVTFNSDGGSTVESQEIEYNKKASRPVSPTKEGYLFMGWYKDESHTEEFDFVNSVITKNITLYAKWEKEPDSITVFFNSKDGSAVEPITNIESGSKITRPADPVREGYRFVGWFKDSGGDFRLEFDFETEVITKSITLYAKWEEIQTYSVVYEINGHGVQPDGLTGVTTLPNVLPVLEAEGYRFEGWYLDNTTFQHQVEAGQELLENTTLYAKWVELTPFEKFLALGNVIYQNEFKDLTQTTPNILDMSGDHQLVPGNIFGYITKDNSFENYSETNSVSVTENGLLLKDVSTVTTNAILYLGEISLKKIDIHVELQVDQVAGKWSILNLINDLESLSPVISVRTGTKTSNKAPLGYMIGDKEYYTNGLAYVENQTMIVDITLDTIHNKVSFKYTQGTNVSEFKDVELTIPVSSINAITFGTAAAASRNVLVEKVAVRSESYELEEFKSVLLEQFDAYYNSLDVETNYTQNGESLIQAYNDGRAAIVAADSEEVLLAELMLAIEAMNSIENDATILLNAKKSEIKDTLETLRDENASKYTFESNQMEFEELFRYALEELERTFDEEWIDQLVTYVTESLNNIQTDEQYLEHYKWQVLDQLREEFRQDNYTYEQNANAYGEAWQIIEEAVLAATNKDETDAAIEEGRNALAAIDTDDVLLEEAKLSAIAELENFGDVSQITDQNILDQIEAVRVNGLNQIQVATSVYEVEELLNEAKTTITTQIEVASMTLDEAKERAKTSLSEYVYSHPYSDDEEIQAALENGNVNIDATTTNAEALQACADAKAVVELIVYKLTSVDELNSFKEDLKARFYLDTAKALFEEGFEDLVATIKNAADLDSVAQELEACKNALSEKEQDAVNLELAAREDYNYNVIQNDTPKVADFAAYSDEVGKGKKPTSGQTFGNFFKITTVGTTSTKNSSTEKGLSTKSSVWEVTTTYDNADLTILYYSTSAGRLFTLKDANGNPFGEGTPDANDVKTSGVYEANTWGKNNPYTITLGTAGKYTIEFDATEHKLASVTLVEKKPQVIVSKVNRLMVDFVSDPVSSGTDYRTLFTNVQLELEVPGQDEMVYVTISEGYNVKLICNGEEAVDMQQAGWYDITVYYGSTPNQYNSICFSVEVI